MRLIRTEEGKTGLIVPKESFSLVPPSVPVFYNPAASINRSVSVAITDATGGSSFCDALAGIGARGVRLATEVRNRKLFVSMVDINGESVKLAHKNARLNGVASRCNFVQSEVNSFLHSRYGKGEKFSYVDVDPFGTPVPFVQAALRATKDRGIVSFTATDTAVLCGVHVKVAERRYGGTPLNNSFHHETGIRLLINAIRREAASLDIGLKPVAVHSTRHYMRAFVRIEVGASKADEGRCAEGYILWCRQCSSLAEGEANGGKICDACGSKLRLAGPLWLGELTEPATIDRSIAVSERLGLPDAKKVLESLKGVDALPPWSFSIEGICSSLHIASVPDASVSDLLRGQGYKTLKQPFEKTGLKTDAPYKEIVNAVAAADGHRGRANG